jgi:hypothetical protein
VATAHQGTYDDGARPDEARPHRGGKVLIGLLVLLVLLGGVLVIADRVAAGYAERAIADRVSQEVARQDAESSRPEVTVDGFPFLTQVLAGRYESIQILMRDVRGSVNGNSLTLPRLDVTARDVRAPLDTLRSGQGDVVASTVDGTATVSYASVAELTERPGLQLAEEGGKLVGTAPLDLFGQRVTVRGAAGLSVDDKGQIRVKFERLTADGLPNLPGAQALISAYAQKISFTVPLPELPFQLVVRDVQVRPEGLVVTAAARDVPLNTAG